MCVKFVWILKIYNARDSRVTSKTYCSEVTHKVKQFQEETLLKKENELL